MKMKWIGLTGSMGTGKSTVSAMLRKRGYAVIDADALAIQALGPGSEALKKVAELFGPQILFPDQSLNRESLAKEVFGDSEKLKQLESIVHPVVQAEVARLRTQYANQGSEIVFYDVPLLFEKKITGFDSIVVVACSEKDQFERIAARNGLSEAAIRDRLSHQVPQAHKIAAADFVIHNDGDFEQLETELVLVLDKLQEKV